MDDESLERLKRLQMEDLGTARREYISTADDTRGPTTRIQDLEACRMSNVAGSEEYRQAQAHRQELSAWSNVHERIGDTDDLENLDSLMDGQTHRAQLIATVRKGGPGVPAGDLHPRFPVAPRRRPAGGTGRGGGVIGTRARVSTHHVGTNPSTIPVQGFKPGMTRNANLGAIRPLVVSHTQRRPLDPALDPEPDFYQQSREHYQGERDRRYNRRPAAPGGRVRRVMPVSMLSTPAEFLAAARTRGMTAQAPEVPRRPGELYSDQLLNDRAAAKSDDEPKIMPVEFPADSHSQAHPAPLQSHAHSSLPASAPAAKQNPGHPAEPLPTSPAIEKAKPSEAIEARYPRFMFHPDLIDAFRLPPPVEPLSKTVQAEKSRRKAFSTDIPQPPRPVRIHSHPESQGVKTSVQQLEDLLLDFSFGPSPDQSPVQPSDAAQTSSTQDNPLARSPAMADLEGLSFSQEPLPPSVSAQSFSPQIKLEYGESPIEEKRPSITAAAHNSVADESAAQEDLVEKKPVAEGTLEQEDELEKLIQANDREGVDRYFGPKIAVFDKLIATSGFGDDLLQNVKKCREALHLEHCQAQQKIAASLSASATATAGQPQHVDDDQSPMNPRHEMVSSKKPDTVIAEATMATESVSSTHRKDRSTSQSQKTPLSASRLNVTAPEFVPGSRASPSTAQKPSTPSKPSRRKPSRPKGHEEDEATEQHIYGDHLLPGGGGRDAEVDPNAFQGPTIIGPGKTPIYDYQLAQSRGLDYVPWPSSTTASPNIPRASSQASASSTPKPRATSNTASLQMSIHAPQNYLPQFFNVNKPVRRSDSGLQASRYATPQDENQKPRS